MLSVDVAVVGAGPCGLGATWRLERLRADGMSVRYVVVDENLDPGGSASSVTTAEGFTFDLGGHVLYVHDVYPQLKELIDRLVPAWHESKPVRGVWTDRRLIPYPVQRNIHRLPAAKMLASLMGLAAVAVRDAIGRRSSRPSADLKSHLRRRFGIPLTHFVLGPMNEKMWAHDPSLLASSWATQRSGSTVPNVAKASIRQTISSIITRRDNPGWTDSTRVRYPLRGGSGAIWSAVARDLRLERQLCGKRVTAIDSLAKTLTLGDGNEIRYAHLLSTIPLDCLLRLIRARPDLDALARELRYSRVHIAGFGMRGSPPSWLAGVHSFHVPQSDIPCWRMNFPAAFSPGNVPSQDHWSVLCETSAVADGATWERSQIAASIEAKLIEYRFVASKHDIVSRWEADLEHGYPVPFLGRDAVLQRIHAALRDIDIVSRGRFGGWKYEVSNQDHTFMQGAEAIDLLLRARAETTYGFPEEIN